MIGVLIMKNGNDYRVNQTRHIPLKEADVNENVKKMVTDTLAAAEKYNLLAAEHYGNRFFVLLFMLLQTRVLYTTFHAK